MNSEATNHLIETNYPGTPCIGEYPETPDQNAASILLTLYLHANPGTPFVEAVEDAILMEESYSDEDEENDSWGARDEYEDEENDSWTASDEDQDDDIVTSTTTTTSTSTSSVSRKRNLEREEENSPKRRRMANLPEWASE